MKRRSRILAVVAVVLLAAALVVVLTTARTAPDTPAAETLPGNSIPTPEATVSGVGAASPAPTAAETPAPTTAPTPTPEPTETPVPTPTPTETPEPEPEPTEAPEPEAAVTLSIVCNRALESAELPAAVRAVLPESGVILSERSVPLAEGDTVWDVLQRVCAAQGVALEANWTPAYNTAYVQGIGHLYEFDCGRGSGWLYRVDGETPGVGCSSFVLKPGDRIEWIYTCDFGNDV